MTIYQKAKSLGFVRIANLVIAAVVVLGLAYAGASYAAPGDTIDFCHAPSGDLDKAKKFLDQPITSWDSPGHEDHDGDFLILNQADEDRCDAIIAGTQCADQIDNADPEDILIDTLDPGCHTDGDANNPNSYDPFDDDEADVIIPPQLGSITIDKNVTGDGADVEQDFNFSLTGSSTSPLNFSLDGNDDAVVYSNLNAGAYSLSELPPPTDWSLTSIACSGETAVESSPASITLAAGEDVICTVTNNYTTPPADSGSITILKDTDNAAGDSVSFDFTGTNGVGAFSVLGDSTDSEAFSSLALGSYTITEDGEDGWSFESASCDGNALWATTTDGVTVTLAEDDDTATCTFVNSMDTAEITLVKLVDNAFGGDAVATEWTLEADGTDHIIGQTGDEEITDAVVLPGEYILAESGGPADYTPSTWDCGNEVVTNGNTITLDDGDDVTCTITNTENAPGTGVIRIAKEVTASSSLAQSFNFDGSWADFQLTGGQSTTTTLTAEGQAYSIFETPIPAGWNLDDISCQVEGNGGSQFSPTTGGGTITLQDGDMVSCIFTNHELPECSNGLDDDGDGKIDYPSLLDVVSDPGCDSPEDDSEDAFSSITIDKEVDGENANANLAFVFNPSWSSDDIFLSGNDAPVTQSGLTPDEYTIDEATTTDWTLGNVTCIDSDTEDSASTTIDLSTGQVTVDIAEAQNVLCTFENTYRPSPGSGDTERIIVRKEVTQGGDTGFDFEFNLVMTTGTTTLSLEHGQEWDSGDLDEGEVYSVSEVVPTGWTQTGVVCTSSGLDPEEDAFDPNPDPSNITLQNGETVTCVFTNAQDPDLFTLDLTLIGDGEGMVAGDGISCDSDSEETDCSETYVAGTVVELTVTPDEGSNFNSSWTVGAGSCTGNATSCSVTMNGNLSLTAHFALNSTNGGGGSSGDDDDDGGRSGSSRRSSGGGDGEVAGASTSAGEVLEAQTSIIPAGAPNTGLGGMSGMAAEGASGLGAILSLFGSLALFAGKRN